MWSDRSWAWPAPANPGDHPHGDRNDDGTLVCSRSVGRRALTRARRATRSGDEPRPNVRHDERHRFAPPRRKTARAIRVTVKGPHQRRGSVKRKTPKRDRPNAWQHRTAHRGRHVLKGKKPHERRPTDITSRRSRNPREARWRGNGRAGGAKVIRPGSCP